MRLRSIKWKKTATPLDKLDAQRALQMKGLRGMPDEVGSPVWKIAPNPRKMLVAG